MAGNWLWMTAADLGRGIEAGKIHPVELTEAFLDAIERHPEAKRIYSRTTPRRARTMSMAAADRAKAGQRIGLLDGVPISWKDLFDASGAPCEAGSALLAGRVPETDAEVLTTATAQGLVCLGKTHLSELAFSGLGLNPITATPPNVNDPKAVPGGSSSGAAASVAFGLAPAGIGSDTGGSVRIPAAWNDLVGLKTTSGRLSLKGVVPLCDRFDTVGPLARSVEDCALLLAAMEGGKPADLTGTSLKGARVMVLDTMAMDDLREEPARGFDGAVDRLARAGARIETAKIGEVVEAMSLAPILYAAEAYGIWGAVIEQNPDKMFRPILDRFRMGAQFSAPDYVSAWRKLLDLRQIWARKTAAYDAVILPTSPILPPDAQRLMEDDDYYVTENLMALRNTRIGNLFGGCAVTMPTGQPSCGITFMAGPGQEEQLLRLCFAAERALG
ncbi:amidase [Pseudorhodobacter sp. E13]|uniref:amidase n=1 Tax=Pseudorhodobacter sp. E13 TaxID=2487931 RepID=UPI000F8F2DBE|nr:amidase family protein [Pseudorhodobacter sp. E13]RUS63395.1 amidase [Pseudorhodobacter sp. E13]